MKFKVIVLVFFVLLISTVATLYLRSNKDLFKRAGPSTTEQVNEFNTFEDNKDDSFPWLDLPTEYFSEDDILWGSVKPDTGGKTISDYDFVALDNKAVYQSYPTTETTIKEYSDEVRPLQIKSFDEIKKSFDPESLWLKEAEDNYKEYGPLANHYQPNLHIQKFDQFDVDADGIKEKIITYNFVGRADGGSYGTDIIKDNNIIFSVDEDNSGIVSADTSNGFYVEWRKPDYSSPRCCEPGFTRTRFIFKDGKFIPLYEQEVKYMIVGPETKTP